MSVLPVACLGLDLEWTFETLGQGVPVAKCPPRRLRLEAVPEGQDWPGRQGEAVFG